MARSLIVETNFLMAVALREGRGCDLVHAAALEGLLHLLVPAASVAEVVKSWESRRRDWQQLENRLAAARSKANEARILNEFEDRLDGAHEALLQMIDRANGAVFEELGRLVGLCRQLETDADVLARAHEAMGFLKLSPADALVVGAVTATAARNGASVFLTLDKGLVDKIQPFLSEQHVQVFTHGTPTLKALGIDVGPLVQAHRNRRDPERT